MNRLLFFAAALLVLLLVSFAVPPIRDAVTTRYSTWKQEQWLRAEKTRIDRIIELNARPPERLPERPLDRSSFPRESFAASFHDGNGFAIDMEAGTVTHDMIVDPDTTISLRLTPAQIDTLYEEALLSRLFETRQPSDIPCGWGGCDHWDGVVTVRAGSTRNSLEWSNWTRTEVWSDDHKRINAYVQTLKRMVEQSPVYRALPRPRGMYFD